MAFEEPQPRYLHAAVNVGQKLYIWGGDANPSIETATIDTFDVPSLAWQHPQRIRGSQLPDHMKCMAVATYGESAYFFGGVSTDFRTCFNTLFKVDLSTLLCTEVGDKTSSTAPKKKYYSSMLYFDHKLVVHGGCTDQGAATDELHVFDLRTGQYICVSQYDCTA